VHAPNYRLLTRRRAR